METYLPNSIKEVSPSAPKTEGTNIFDNYQSSLLKDDKWAFPDKDSYVGKMGVISSSTLTQVSKAHLQETRI